MTTTAIVPMSGVTNTNDAITIGKVLAQSGYFTDAKDAAQAAVKVLAGQEMGIGPIAAMTGIYLVKGRVTLSANLMAAQVKRSGRYSYHVARLDDTGCELIFSEAGKEIGRSSFDADDAKAAGLWGSSDPWKKTPRNMLFARAMSNGVKWFTPDIFSGPVYTPDELSNEIDVLPPAPPVNSTTGEVVEAPAALPAPGGRDAGAYVAMGRKLKERYEYTNDDLRRSAVAYKTDVVSGMPEVEYNKLMERMREMERMALSRPTSNEVEAEMNEIAEAVA